MQYAFGLFVFSSQTAPLAAASRRRNWRYARPAVHADRAPGKYLGPGDDALSFSGTISHDIAGQALSLDALDLLATEGKAWPLVRGDGQVLGSYQLESVEETQRELFPNGQPRAIDFTLSLMRVADEQTDALALITAPLALL